MADPTVLQLINERLNAIERKVDHLIGFRWMLIGGSAVVSAAVGVLVAIYFGR